MNKFYSFLLSLAVTYFSQIALAQSVSVYLKNQNSIDGSNPIIDVFIEGPIIEALALELEEKLNAIKIRQEMDLNVSINSIIGEIKAGSQIVDVLKSFSSANPIEYSTHVRNGKVCGGPCLAIFLSSDIRVAGTVSAFLFNGFSSSKDPKKISKAKTQIFQDEFFLSGQGVNIDWLETLWDLGVFSESGEYWVSGKELVDMESGIVTRLGHRRTKSKTLKM